VPRLQKKSFANADDVRLLGHGRFDVVNLDETSVGRIKMDPGWRWSTDAKPKVGGTSCQVRHLGAALSGVLHIVADDGLEMDLRGGEAYEIPPGHDAWVVGDAPYEAIEFASARTFLAPTASVTRTLGTILMTDIVNSTATLERVGDAKWHAMLLEHNDRLRTQIDRFGGREVRTTGDGFQVLFTGAERGVQCASAMIDALADLEIRIRAGLHTGDVELAAGTSTGSRCTPRRGSAPSRGRARSSCRR
jgi:Adenylate and Guanylate cyclase catalytic domain